jgi:hypothetical protein
MNIIVINKPFIFHKRKTQTGSKRFHSNIFQQQQQHHQQLQQQLQQQQQQNNKMITTKIIVIDEQIIFRLKGNHKPHHIPSHLDLCQQHHQPQPQQQQQQQKMLHEKSF